MADYARIAEQHWRTFRPRATAKMRNPSAFFQNLAARVEQRVNDLADDLLAKEPPETEYEDRVAQIERANRKAEEIVLAQEVYLPPEPGQANNELPREGTPYPTAGPPTSQA